MLTKRTATVLLLALTVASLPLTSQTKSKVLATWEQVEVLVDGKPFERPSNIPRNATSPAMMLKLSLKG
ncbi:MAG: hypothetical protein ABIP81_04325, partial [Terriglobales bacterium]